MNKKQVEHAIDRIQGLMNRHGCGTGEELAYHADTCLMAAKNYEEESKEFGRGVPKALRAELLGKIEELKEKAAFFATKEAQDDIDNYTLKLRRARAARPARKNNVVSLLVNYKSKLNRN